MLFSTTTTVTDAGGHASAPFTSTCTIGESFVLGTTEPTAANTGLGVEGLTLADMTVIPGDLNITPAYMSANGNTIDRVLVEGHVVFTGTAPFTISNSVIRGRPFTGAPPRSAIVYARLTSTPASAVLNLTNCEVYPVQPHVGIVCASGERLGTIIRPNFHHGSDLINYWGSTPKVYGGYLHDYTFWANDPKHTNDGAHPGWSHNDLIQNSASANARIRGNSFDCRAAVDAGDVATLTGAGFSARDWGTSVMFTPSDGTITGAEVEENWFRFGQCPVCLPLQSSGSFNTGNSWSVEGNRFGELPHAYGTNSRQLIRWGNTMGPAAGSCSGNVFLSTAGVPTALRGTALPAAILQGNNDASGQLMVRVLQT
jgi:hypothetical protein